MAGTGVFVLKDDRTITALQSAEFARESDFQALLGEFPQLLAGDQMDAASPRRFLLIDREMPIPAETSGVGRWFLDHLFIDQDAVPTLVEVKRQSDMRLRREVIGQILEYAAHASELWPPHSLRAGFERRCGLQEVEPSDELARHLGGGADTDADAFWAHAGENLAAGRVRLVLVADLIPQEVRRVVEYLNRQMSPAEVLAVELRQFEGEGLRALAPLVFGQSEEAAERKRSRAPAPRWTAASIVEALAGDPQAHAAASEIIAWSEANASRVQVTAGGGAGPVLRCGDVQLYPFLIDPKGQLTLYFDYLADRPVFAVRTRREAWAGQMAAAGLPVSTRELDGRQTVPMGGFTPAVTQAFLTAMDWFNAQLEA